MLNREGPFHSCDQPLSSCVDGVLFDLDGVVYRGTHAVEHAVEAINALEIPHGYVTNNASRPPSDVSQHLTDLGIRATEDEITTSAQAAAGLVESTYGTEIKVLAVGGEGLRAALTERGLTLVSSADDAPDVVVQGTSSTLTWADLAEGVYAINRGADYIATNLDSTMPTERGMGPGNGAMVQAVAHATGVFPQRAAGKPDPQIFRHAAERAQMREPVVVGDRLDTDISGAREAGLAALVVLTGVASAKDLLLSAPAERPTLLGYDLRDLHRAHPPVRGEAEGWACRDAYAAAEDGELTVTEAGQRATLTGSGQAVTISLDALRAACAAAWTGEAELKCDREIHISG